jgi:hypothetical protein
MAMASYSCQALVGTNKAGQLKKDDNGYYYVVLGALDFYNSKGDFYSFQSAKHLFESSSNLMRRVKNGNLRGECGHPRKAGNQSMTEYIYRILDIFEPNTSHHIREVIIDDTSMKDKNGKPVVLIRGWVKPSGPMGPALQKAFDNPDENVCFSIRSLTQDTRAPGGTFIKHLQEIATWDWVNEPGISVANKYSDPSLESLGDVLFTRSHLEAVRDLQLKLGNGMESHGGVSAESLLNKFDWVKPDNMSIMVPKSSAW